MNSILTGRGANFGGFVTYLPVFFVVGGGGTFLIIFLLLTLLLFKSFKSLLNPLFNHISSNQVFLFDTIKHKTKLSIL